MAVGLQTEINVTGAISASLSWSLAGSSTTLDMIRDVLIPVLVQRFPGRGMRLGRASEPHVVFPATHPGVGDVSIWDDGDEATLAVGDITHGHFNPYEEHLSETQLAHSVTEMVVEFLDALFSDRVVLWCSKDRRSGGWRVVDEPASTVPIDLSGDVFVWSGPLSVRHK
jgi:hypothetical protein